MRKLRFQDVWRPILREAIALGAGILTIVIAVALFFVALDSELAVAPAVAA